MSTIQTARDKYGSELVEYRVMLEKNQSAMFGDGVWISGYGQVRERTRETRGGVWTAILRMLGMLRMW